MQKWRHCKNNSVRTWCTQMELTQERFHGDCRARLDSWSPGEEHTHNNIFTYPVCQYKINLPDLKVKIVRKILKWLNSHCFGEGTLGTDTSAEISVQSCGATLPLLSCLQTGYSTSIKLQNKWQRAHTGTFDLSWTLLARSYFAHVVILDHNTTIGFSSTHVSVSLEWRPQALKHKSKMLHISCHFYSISVWNNGCWMNCLRSSELPRRSLPGEAQMIQDLACFWQLNDQQQFCP